MCTVDTVVCTMESERRKERKERHEAERKDMLGYTDMQGIVSRRKSGSTYARPKCLQSHLEWEWL